MLPDRGGIHSNDYSRQVTVFRNIHIVYQFLLRLIVESLPVRRDSPFIQTLRRQVCAIR